LGGKVVVGFAGSLKPWHGVVELVAAFASLASCGHLLLFRDGPEREAVALAASPLGSRAA
jgi:glycosyltransferase involved in cell wall biosynthesis